jgi:hypothetical protein
MIRSSVRAALLAALLALPATLATAADDPVVPRPPALVMENVPQVPVSLAEATRPYLEYR